MKTADVVETGKAHKGTDFYVFGTQNLIETSLKYVKLVMHATRLFMSTVSREIRKVHYRM